jgi:hypothetical protein
MDDQLDVPLEDSELLAEVELTTNLMIAASEVESLAPQEVDRLLGLEVGEPPTGGPAAGENARAATPRSIPEQKTRHDG